MNIIQFKRDMKQLSELYKNADKLNVKLAELFGSNTFDSKYFNGLFESIDYSIGLLRKIYGDKDDYISWYIYDNDWGANKYEVELHEDDVVEVDSIVKLWYVITEEGKNG